MKRMFVDLTGLCLNGFTVLSLHSIVKKGKQTRTYWNCKCKCGNTIKLRADVIRKTIACNCSRERFIDKTAVLDGTTKTMKEWAKYYGIEVSHIRDRVRYGMPIETAIKTPVGKSGVNIR